MGDEHRFADAMLRSNAFTHVDVMFFLVHPTLPSSRIEVDNAGQKGTAIFVFEGKRWQENDVVRQLKVRKETFRISYSRIINTGAFSPYKTVRLFHYSLARKTLRELDPKMKFFPAMHFKNINELIDMLRNL